MVLDRDAFEPLTNWARRTRTHFEAIGKFWENNFKLSPLIIEVVGMGGTGKSRLIGELKSKYFNNFGYQIGGFVEPQEQIHNVSRQKPKEFRRAQYEITCQNLEKVLSGRNDLVFFDRGLLDFFVWVNLDFRDGILNKQECREYIEDIFSRGKDKIDFLFVFIGPIEKCLKGKKIIQSIPFMDSFGLRSRSEEETLKRFGYYHNLYPEFFLRDGTKVQKTVNYLMGVDIGKPGYNFENVFQEAVIVINLYLVFKAWESLFRVYSEKRMMNEEEIARGLSLLIYPFVSLRRDLDSFNSRFKKTFDPRLEKKLEEFLASEFIIGRYNSKRIKVRDLFSHPLKFKID